MASTPSRSAKPIPNLNGVRSGGSRTERGRGGQQGRSEPKADGRQTRAAADANERGRGQTQTRPALSSGARLRGGAASP
ncbi:hypothetical protein PSCLAVI8L_10063 [Pseudoclavibacter sp. 8L]|nr:hypothetical protein PSCLAVI8L_10063 [Pseudoclavibacter sp. 8L]